MYPMEQTLLSSREQGQEGGDTRSNASDASYLLCRHNKTSISARIIILTLETMFTHSNSWLNNSESRALNFFLKKTNRYQMKLCMT
jgi:hypothetical protein